jgi:glycosyltransferase involved in cell wall biosynthesis
VPDAAIRERIDLPGAVPLEKVSTLLRAARVAVVSSRGFESFSYAALESLSAGRPVVATATGALPEIVEHEQTGLIVPAADPKMMALAIEKLLSDRNLSEAYARAGFEMARQRCHTPRVMPKILECYEEATNFYSHVKAARSERTALRWREAIEAARDGEEAVEQDEPIARFEHAQIDVA